VTTRAALLAVVAALLVAPAPARFLADEARPVAPPPGLSVSEALAWLEEEVEAHGRFDLEYRSERLVLRAAFAYRLVPEPAGPCTVAVELKITSLDDAAPSAHPGVPDGVVGVFRLESVRLAGVAVRPWPDDPKVRAVPPTPGARVRCVQIPLQRNASRSTTATDPGMRYEYESGEVCLADPAAAERVARGIRYVARLCGARP
jgi:hypothetical protein